MITKKRAVRLAYKMPIRTAPAQIKNGQFSPACLVKQFE